jgi:hypothetical protein
MSVIIQGSQVRTVLLGICVNRATEALPADASAEALFTITGGRVVLTSLVGKVTTALQAQANAVKLTYNPTAAGTSFDLCTAVETNADAVGQTYYIAGNVASPGALLVGGAVGQANPVFTAPLMLDNGTIDVDCADGGTGSVSWTVTYIPLDDGAALVAS